MNNILSLITPEQQLKVAHAELKELRSIVLEAKKANAALAIEAHGMAGRFFAAVMALGGTFEFDSTLAPESVSVDKHVDPATHRETWTVKEKSLIVTQ